MAELDDKLLKNLDKTLEDMTTHLQGIETALKGVKNGLESTFNPAILKSFSDELRGMKAARLIDAEANVSEVNKIYSAIQEFDRRVKTGTKLEFLSEAQIEKYKQELNEIERRLDAVAGKRLKGEEWLDRKALYDRRDMLRDIVTSDQPMVAVPLSKKELEEAVELLKKYKELYAGITKGEQQRAVELANIYAKERKADMKSADDALAQTEQEERKKFEIERAWNEKSTKEAEQRDKQKLATEKATADERLAIIDAEAKKRAEMEQGWAEIERQRQEREAKAAKEMAQIGEIAARKRLTGTLAALEDQTAVNEWRKQTAEEQKRIAKETAAIQKKADAESMANQRRQIQIKSQLAAIDKNRISITKQSSDREKALAAQQQADYRSLQSELSKLIARQKELNAVSQGSGRRAKDRLSTYTISESEKAMHRYADAVRNAHREQKKLGDETNKMLPTLQRLASAFGIAFSIRGLAQFGKKLIEVRGEFELQQVALRSILQNKQLADEIWDKTLRASLQSPFTAMQLTTYTKQLAAYRIETAKLFDTTKRLADVSAGLGVDMQRLILAYGQVKAANYLRASEIRQFTEAGVNILGELSQYFTEAKGEMVSTAQVMDMVQKRMVKFEDVAEIFKRMTDQGGIFYNMQYIQSQTVQGQMMKLKDAFDQMLNSIGQGNEGTIKNLISLLNDMVRNWRSIAIALKSIGWGIAINWVGKYALALTGLTKVTKTTAAGIVKLKTVLSSLSSFITLPTILISIATALLSMQQRMRAVNKEIDEQNYKLYESQKYFEELRYKIHLNNSYIDDETSSEEENTQAKEANRAIMQKLINEYPQLAAQMEINEDGLISMNDALDVNIRKLNEQRNIINAMKAKGIFSDTDQKNLSDWELKLSNIRVSMNSIVTSAESIVRAMETNGLAGTKVYNIYKQIAELDFESNALKASQDLYKIIEAVRDIPLGELDNINKGLEDFSEYQLSTWWPERTIEKKLGIGSPLVPWSKSFKLFDFIDDEGRAIEALYNVESALMDAYKNGIKDNKQYLEEVGNMTTEEFTQWIIDNAGRLNVDTAKGINKANDIFIKTLAPQTEEMKAYLNKYFNDLLGIDEMAFVRAEARLGWLRQKVAEHEALPQLGMLENPDRIAAYEAVLKEIEQLESFLKNRGIDFFAIAENIGGTTEPDFELNAANLRKQVNLLEEMKKRYDELSKSAYGYAKSEAKVREAFKDSFEEIFKGTGIDMKDIDFTSMEGLSASIQKVLDAATNIKEEVKQEVMKKIDSYEARIEIAPQVRVRENFAREIEKMFSDYELTLNFESIGLPSDLAKKLFGVDTSSLDEISSYMKNFVSEHTSDWNDEINKVYINALQKISDKEQEMYKKNVSNLFKRVKNSADEMKTVMAQAAADINFADMLFDKQEAQKNIDTITEQIEKNIEEIRRLTPADGKATGVAAQQIARLEAENKILQNRVLRLSQMYGNLSAEQYTDLVKATMEHENEQLQKISLEQLKQLPEYIEAMGRTAGWSNEKLREMLDYLQNLISVSGGNIDITEYKSIINQIDKIQAEIKHNDYPFGREGFAKVAQMLQEQSEAEAKLNELTEERNQLIAEQKLLELEEIELQARLNKLKAKGLDENSTEIQEIMDDIKSNQKFKISNLNAQKKNAAGIQTITKGNAQTMAIIDAIIHGINNLVQEIYQNLKKVEILLQDYEVDTEHGKWAKWSKGMETFAKASQDATNGWEAYKKGDIAGIVYEVINGITDIWHGINEMVSQKHVDTIYEMEQELERLTVAYEKLQKAIEKTWDTSSYMMNYEKMVKNLEDQRKALQAQYDAEDARKNSDEEKMKEYQNSIRDIDETLTELKQKQIEVFGGLGEVNYRSAAQEFVDAWKDAFLETGDGLQGLQDHFDEFLNEWFVKQATMRIAGRMLEPLFREIDNAVDESSLGGTSVLLSELQRVREKFATIAPQLSDSLEQLAGMWGLGGEGSLSGLAAGIQGMSEEQANILEAYWNSVRMYTASIDMNVSRIADMLGAGSRDITNPQLQQLQLIAANAQATHQLLLSTSKSGHPMGGYGFKVFND